MMKSKEEIVPMMKSKAPLYVSFLVALILPLSGCTTRYVANRVADFGDIFQLGAGLTAENPKSGILPPALGAHIQATEFLNLGAVTFHGYSAEWDGRGLFAGYEDRTRLGILSYQEIQINQNYVDGYENYFKKGNSLWNDRMNTELRSYNRPAKGLEYDVWSISRHRGSPILHRGWHYWENFNAEVAIADPFLTHFGLTLRLGFDPSEIFDFVLGVFRFDFKKDDLTPEEFVEFGVMHQVMPSLDEPKPASDRE